MDGGSGADAAGGDAVSAPDWLAARRCSAAQRVGSNYVWDIPSNARPIPVPGSGYCIAAAAVGQANAPEQFAAAMLASVEEHPAYFNNFIPDAASLLPLARARPRTVYHDPELAPLAHMMPVALSASLKRRVLVGMPVHLECPHWIEVTPPFLTAEMRAADPVRILYNGVNHYYGYGVLDDVGVDQVQYASTGLRVSWIDWVEGNANHWELLRRNEAADPTDKVVAEDAVLNPLGHPFLKKCLEMTNGELDRYLASPANHARLEELVTSIWVAADNVNIRFNAPERARKKNDGIPPITDLHVNIVSQIVYSLPGIGERYDKARKVPMGLRRQSK